MVLCHHFFKLHKVTLHTLNLTFSAFFFILTLFASFLLAAGFPTPKLVAVQCADLRSSVVRAACAALGAIAAEHGKAIGPLAVGVLPTLLKNLYVSVKAISAASEAESSTCDLRRYP